MKFIGLIIALNLSFAFGQMLDNRDGNAFTGQPFFNADFIQRNHLKRISGTFMIRKPGSSFRKTEYYQTFEFSQEGELSLQSETYPEDGTIDTTLTEYGYDGANNLVLIRKKTRDGFIAQDFSLDSNGRIVEEVVSKEFYDTSTQDVLYTDVNKETFTYFEVDDQVKKVSYNSYGLPYLEEIFYYNEDGYLLKKTEKIRMTSTVYTYNYSYNDKGLLASIEKTAAGKEEVLEKYVFEYDEFNNLSEKHVYRNGVYTTEIQIIYNNKTGLLSSVITRAVATGVMAILRFDDFEYYD